MLPILIIIIIHLIQAITCTIEAHITAQLKRRHLVEQSIPVPKGIPGGSPLHHCNDSRSTGDLYQIDSIELYPRPLHM